MRGIYAYPLRVYLVLGLIAVLGVISGLKLPVSLFPNSARPEIEVSGNFGPLTAEEYQRTYGDSLEYSLRGANSKDLTLEQLEARYSSNDVRMSLKFKWGDDRDLALKEVERILVQTRSRFPNQREYALNAWARSENQGFFAISFFSSSRTPTEIYKDLEPVLRPRAEMVSDASTPYLGNPDEQEVRIELNQDTMTHLQIGTLQVDEAIRAAFGTRQGGSVMIGESSVSVTMPRQVYKISDLENIIVISPAKKMVRLREFAKISVTASEQAQNIYKTNGSSGLILFASPKPDGNIKAMSEDLKKVVDDVMKQMPKDIDYRILVDPSDSIKDSISNVIHEVILGSCLAVLVLFIFIGSPKNVITAAIEIPISLILAFLLMRLWNMNLNLISLGGLALSCGMNVDASVVVMENIFRHFESKSGQLNFEEKLNTVITAVREVAAPVIVSTIASLVVFVPLAFTSNLTYAILGDLAKAIVFSHAFSAVVALILVPTVRLQILGRETVIQHPRSPIESNLKKMEALYGRILTKFMNIPRGNFYGAGACIAVLVGLFLFVVPKLPTEVIGKPETDWIFIGVNTSGNTKARQMEATADELERKLIEQHQSKILYTFTQIWHANGGGVMLRLKEKSDLTSLVKEIEKEFSATPTLQYFVEAWNPSELPLPNPPKMEIGVTASNLTIRNLALKEISDLLSGAQVFPRISTKPYLSNENVLLIKPKEEQIALAKLQGFNASIENVMEQLNMLTRGRRVDMVPFENEKMNVTLYFKDKGPKSELELEAFPIPIGRKRIPFKAFADITKVKESPYVFRNNGQEVALIQGSGQSLTVEESKEGLTKSKEIVDKWKQDFSIRPESKKGSLSIEFLDGEREITDAIRQLYVAIGCSILLIFITMVLQFGSIMEPLIVLMAIPLGMIGVLVSLFVFGSTLSLNSALGVILLNGIAVANSIILVDFAKKLSDEGYPPHEAVVSAAKARLRPILITSLTTVLGMIPIALGLGSGGKVLQPLGIAVSGGLWVSMILTLFLVPSVHGSYLAWRRSRA